MNETPAIELVWSPLRPNYNSKINQSQFLVYFIFSIFIFILYILVVIYFSFYLFWFYFILFYFILFKLILFLLCRMEAGAGHKFRNNSEIYPPAALRL